MKSKFIIGNRTTFEDLLNKALEELKNNEIVDVKFTQGSGNNGGVILSGLILYK